MKTIVALLFGVLGTTLVIGGIQVSESMLQIRYLKNDIQQMKAKRDEMRLDWSQLVLEESTLTDEALIYQAARNDLGMFLPKSDAVVFKPKDQK